MKNKLLQLSIAAALGLLTAIPAQAQKKSLRAFCREYRGQAEIHTIGVGRPLLLLASWIVPKEDEETAAAKMLLRKLRHVKVYTLEVDSDAKVDNGAMARLKTRLEKEHFESLADIRSEGSVVHVMSQGKEDDLGNVVLMVKDDNEVVFVSLRTRLKLTDVSTLVNKFGGPQLKDLSGKKQPIENVNKPVADSAATVAIQTN